VEKQYIYLNKKRMENTTKQIEISKLTEATVYAENPFIDQMVGELKIKNKTQMLKGAGGDKNMLVISADGETLAHSAFMRRVQVDEDKFAKLFLSQLSAFWDLKKTSMKVLSYILIALKPNSDKVYFDMEECMAYCEWTGTQSVYNGLIGLIKANIIARSKKGYIFYINPAILFNGSRVTFISTFEKAPKKTPPINPKQTSLLDQIEEDSISDQPNIVDGLNTSLNYKDDGTGLMELTAKK